MRILAAKRLDILLCAPTGRAAKCITDTTGREAKIIHRLLETDPKTGQFRRNETNPLACDLLVVDETSMVDVTLMHALMKAIDRRTALLLVGDVDQLPPVGPGQALADIIASNAVPVVRLTQVFRQAGTLPMIAPVAGLSTGNVDAFSAPIHSPSAKQRSVNNDGSLSCDETVMAFCGLPRS